MKRNKKILSVLLILIVVVASVGILTACGESDNYKDMGTVNVNGTIANFSVGSQKTVTVQSKFRFNGNTGYYRIGGFNTNDARSDQYLEKLQMKSIVLYTNAKASSKVKTVSANGYNCYYLQNGHMYYCKSTVKNTSKRTVKAFIQLRNHTDSYSVKKSRTYDYMPSMIWKDRNFIQDFSKELPGNVIRNQTVMKIWFNRSDLSDMMNIYSNSDDIGSLYDAAIKYFNSNDKNTKSKAKEELVNDANKLATSLAKKTSKQALRKFVEGIAKTPGKFLKAIDFIYWGIDTAKEIFNIKSELIERGNDLLKAMKADDSLADFNVRDGIRTYLSGVIVTIQWHHISTRSTNINNYRAAISHSITEKISFKKWNDDWRTKKQVTYSGAKMQIGDFYYWNSTKGAAVYNNWAKEYNRKVSVNGKTLSSTVFSIYS